MTTYIETNDPYPATSNQPTSHHPPATTHQPDAPVRGSVFLSKEIAKNRGSAARSRQCSKTPYQCRKQQATQTPQIATKIKSKSKKIDLVAEALPYGKTRPQVLSLFIVITLSGSSFCRYLRCLCRLFFYAQVPCF